MRVAVFVGVAVVLGALAVWWLAQDESTRAEDATITGAPDDAGGAPRAGLDGAGAPITARDPDEPTLGPGAGVVRGTVEDTSGAPLADMVIELLRLSERPGSWMAPARVGRPQRFLPAGSARSDSAGRFVFRAVPNGEYHVRAVGSPPWFTAETWAHVGTFSTGKQVRLIVGQGRVLRLRVVDAEGRGIEAWLAGYRERDKPDTTWFPWGFSALRTDAEGRAQVVAPAARIRINVAVPRRGRRTGVLVDTPKDDEVVIAFADSDGATLLGRVVDTAGRPIANARVMASARRGGWSGEGLKIFTTSAEDGTYRLAGLLAGTLDQVAVSAPGYLAIDNFAPSQPLEAGAEIRVDLTLIRGGVIEGNVSGPSGEPIVGAEVEAHADGQRRFATTDRATSDARGRYRLATVPLGQGTLRVSARGYYQSRRDGGSVGARFEITEEGERQALDIVLARGTPIEGRVVDADERPVSGAQIKIHGSSAEGPAWPGDGERDRVSGPDGAFRYEGVPPSRTWTLRAALDGALGGPVVVSIVAGEDPPAPVEIAIRPGASIRGRVAVDGQPPATRLRVHVRANQRGVRTEPVGGDGGFRIDALEPATVEIYAVDRNHSRVSNTVTRTLEWGGVIEDVVLEAESLGTIAGVVVNPDGVPVGDLRLTLHVETPNRSSARTESTNASGRFEFGSLKDTGYAYSISVDGQKFPGTLRLGDTSVRLVHDGYETVYFTGTVRLPDGMLAEAGRVIVSEVIPAGGRDLGSRMGHSATIRSGVFSMRLERRRRDSTFEAEVRHVTDTLGRPISILPWTSTAVVPGTPIEVDLAEGLAIEGAVVDPSGVGVGGVSVKLQAAEGSAQHRHFHGATATTREDGTFGFVSLGRGAYELEVLTRPPWVRPPKRAVKAGTRDVEIALVRAVTLSGHVVDAAGKSVAGSMVRFYWDVGGTSMNARATSGDEGAFTFRAVPPGVRGRLVAQPPRSNDGGWMQGSTDDVQSDATDAVVTLPVGVTITGDVTDPDGEPLAFAQLWCQPVGPVTSGAQHYLARVDEGATSFILGPMPPGRYRITTHMGGAFVAPDPVEITAPASGVRIIARRGNVVAGTVEGAAVMGDRLIVQFVLLTVDGPVSHGGGVTLAGEFSITMKADTPGTVFVQERDGDHYGLVEHVRPSESPFKVDLREGRRISGRIDGYERGSADGYVYLQGATGITINATVAADGSFEARGVPPGEYDVIGFQQGGRLEPRHGVPAGATNVVLVQK